MHTSKWKGPRDYFNTHVSHFITPLDEAVVEIKKRRQDTKLIQKVEAYLRQDVPSYFKDKSPVFYFARHVATPNNELFELLRSLETYDLPLIISNDSEDIYVTNNDLKYSVSKMKVSLGFNRHNEEIFQKFPLFDLKEATGKKLGSLKTFGGKNLIDFHNELLKEVVPSSTIIVDEADWITRNGRGNLKEHYKRMLALLIVHGIMFETYPEEEADFVDMILKPTFDEITETLGHRPLIVWHIPPEIEKDRDWNAYPNIFLEKVREQAGIKDHEQQK